MYHSLILISYYNSFKSVRLRNELIYKVVKNWDDRIKQLLNMMKPLWVLQVLQSEGLQVLST